ncbi:MAG: preprotein translocase subunit SecY [Candidatus Riflebacteria bacterium]|jgi:preprotein translocase subunit SecY|nr:preprotein translocase subunit SecY [Candidatus Riflebacteria bacterium]MDD3376575.1 preprotein translocase subunit SecY [Candidatus Riflebacteria bacterium]
MKIPELRNRILFTLGMILVFRLGTHIPTPGIDAALLTSKLPDNSELLSFLNMFSGGALKRFSVFALGIAPYINSSIIMQLLVYVIPYFEHLAKEEGEDGRKKINQYTRYGTVLIGALQALGISFMLERYQIVVNPGWGFKLMALITLTAGTAFIMWLGEQMTARGIGNGISILITAGILASLPEAIVEQFMLFSGQAHDVVKTLMLLVLVLITIMLIVYVQDGVRKIPVQYAKRVVGRRVYGGQNTYIPLRVNQAGVIPVIFASSILMFPAMICSWIQNLDSMQDVLASNRFVFWLLNIFNYNSWTYLVIYVALIIFFTYFYTAISFNVQDLADNMKKYGGFIPGIRAGQKTVDFLERTVSRVTLAGGIFLAVVSVIPNLLIMFMNVNFYFGGTALLIVVGVAMDTMRQLESHLVTRHYEGFMKKKGLR